MSAFKEIDSPVQMRLYALTKYRFVLVFVTFILAVLFTLIVGVFGPGAIGETTKTAKQLGVQPKKFQTGPYVLNSGIMTQFNQELWLFCKFQLTDLPRKNFKYEHNFDLSVQLMGSSKDTSYKSINRIHRNHTRTLVCHRNSCDGLVLFHLGSLQHPSYSAKIRFYNLHLPRGVKIRNVVFTFKYYEEQFTQIQIWFRFVFLVFSFTVTCMFMHSLRKFPISDWCIEQRWMSALLPLLMLYNDPLYPLNFLINGWVFRMLDVIFQGSFFAALLMFWLCAFHGIRKSERHFLQFYLAKIVLIGLMWATGCTILGWQQYNELQDPSYQYKVDTGNFMVLKTFFLVVFTGYTIYLLILAIKAFRDLRNLPFFDIRLRFLTLLMSLVIVIGLVAVALRFGSAILQNNFVMDVTTNYRNSAEFLTFYSLLNIYLYTMAFVYSPSPRAIRDASNKNSMFSDTSKDPDDDIVFQRKSKQLDFDNVYSEVK